MKTDTLEWRVPLWAWAPIGLGIVAETVSNGLRAYGLGQHLEQFSVTAYGHHVSLSGGVMALAALAVSLSQSRAWWIALTPGALRQRIVAGVTGALLLAISITAMASHVLEAQRAKDGDEMGAAKAYARAETAYKAAKAELDGLGNPRAVAIVQAEVQAAKIDMRIWRRSAQCTDISKEDTKAACQPILALYKERGAAARKTELEPEVARLRDQLSAMQKPKAKASQTESTVVGWWAWIMGLGVVMIATFGPVLFATVTASGPSVADTRQTSFAAPELPPSGGPGKRRKGPETQARQQLPANVVRLADNRKPDIVSALEVAGKPLTVSELALAMGVTKGEASRRWREAGNLVRAQRQGRFVVVQLVTSVAA